MTFDKLLIASSGNDKRVSVFAIFDKSGEPLGWSCEVEYTDHPELDFSERKPSRADAIRWFNTWKLITS